MYCELRRDSKQPRSEHGIQASPEHPWGEWRPPGSQATEEHVQVSPAITECGDPYLDPHWPCSEREHDSLPGKKDLANLSWSLFGFL